MFNKPIVKVILVLLAFSSFFIFDMYYKAAIFNNLGEQNYNAVQTKLKSYYYNRLDPVEKMHLNSYSRSLKKGEYIVGKKMMENNEDKTIYPGNYIVKNPLFNIQSFKLNNNEYVVESFISDKEPKEIHISLKQGDVITIITRNLLFENDFDVK